MKSLTGYASLEGQVEALQWQWELRSVNGKGLDVRVRMPDWCVVIEAEARKRLSAQVARGNISVNLRMQAAQGQGGASLDRDALDRTLAMLVEVEDRANHIGVSLAATSAADILALRGVLTEDTRPDGLSDSAQAALLAAFDQVLAAFIDSRISEGAALKDVLTRQVDEIAAQLDAIRAIVPDRAAAQSEALKTGIARLLDTEALDAARLHQEAALLAVKSDITEEIDRLTVHVEAARKLIAAKVPVGRKFDFLCQEFNREANTLCSKSQHSGLTELGLEMKVTIDQMREQIQNVE
ncbi:YicC/YloC family endoribonuclease [Donghicola tyrosinivorans]|uniref:Uncharacterized protein (TIGR00255 family) n=1 Tax=Donghicola tyrosinivorans TaxID=1652492 RepID=A0A2T0WTZ7_9RHOB|nr:YicC/YloC family endoribonuclease [Donghicola tyrosinivorans]PRY90034.1 uncharacterized protein (TIGR00255 family) [Donghicola tyrosinivorans]